MTQLLLQLEKLYSLKADGLQMFPKHEGGRNTVYRHSDMVIRVSAFEDRTFGDYCAETEYVDFLHKNGADVVRVIPSINNNFVEKITADGTTYFVTAFSLAKGDQIAEHGYKYRDGVPIEEYFFNCGKTLGKIHALSQKYAIKADTKNIRFDFFDKYNEPYFDALIPNKFTELKRALGTLLQKLRAEPKTNQNYGMVHFDFSDGNYNIDYANGNITVFDFENCRNFFYMYDLANLWTHGVGWIAWENDTQKRKTFMEHYFREVVRGYKTQTSVSDEELNKLPLFIQAVLMENIIDEFEVQKQETGTYEYDEEQEERIRLMINGTKFMGFFE